MEAIYNGRIGSYLGVPIILEDGHLFGTLCAVDPDPYDFDQNEIKRMKHLGNILSSLIFKEKTTPIPKIDERILRLDKLALVGQLSAGLAHEIRNPMQTVKGFIQHLFNDHNKEVSEYKNIVIDELDRINQLITDFLLVTQPSAPKKEKSSITDIIKETIKFLQNEATLHNIEILFKKEEEEIPDIPFDPAQMRQVFINLIKNAIEAVGENGKITIFVKKNNETITINIKDNGPGIPLSIINMVGNPFFTTKETGVGLGLSICKTIVKEHQGTINIENHKDGTLVYIQLPFDS